MEKTLTLNEKEYQFLQSLLNLAKKYGQQTIEDIQSKVDSIPKWAKTGNHQVYRPTKRISLRGDGPLASEMLIEDRN